MLELESILRGSMESSDPFIYCTNIRYRVSNRRRPEPVHSTDFEARIRWFVETELEKENDTDVREADFGPKASVCG